MEFVVVRKKGKTTLKEVRGRREGKGVIDLLEKIHSKSALQQL